MGKMLAAAAVVAAAVTMFCAAPADADPPPPGCERVPFFGLNPQWREICDLPIQPDGSWTRWRWFWHPEFVHSGCGQYGGFVDGMYYCPPWAPKDTIPAERTTVEEYVVTADTVPPGEPGYIGG
ncbi:MAG: hypothetical protein WCJ42_11990 [Actinomycetes bacterium]